MEIVAPLRGRGLVGFDAPPDQQHWLPQSMDFAPHHAEFEVRSRERPTHRHGRGQRLRLTGDGEPLVDQVLGDDFLVEDHDAQEPRTDAGYIVCARIQVVYAGVNLTSPDACGQTTF